MFAIASTVRNGMPARAAISRAPDEKPVVETANTLSKHRSLIPHRYSGYRFRHDAAMGDNSLAGRPGPRASGCSCPTARASVVATNRLRLTPSALAACTSDRCRLLDTRTLKRMQPVTTSHGGVSWRYPKNSRKRPVSPPSSFRSVSHGSVPKEQDRAGNRAGL